MTEQPQIRAHFKHQVSRALKCCGSAWCREGMLEFPAELGIAFLSRRDGQKSHFWSLTLTVFTHGIRLGPMKLGSGCRFTFLELPLSDPTWSVPVVVGLTILARCDC